MKIAAVQFESLHGRITENLIRHEQQIVAAKSNGADMILFPELSICGYIPNYSLWNVLANTKTDIIKWMKEISKEYEVYLGVGLFEYLNNEIRNTYIITDQNGNMLGRAEKNHAESYVFRMGNGVHIIQLGDFKIGVCICADNHFTEIVQQLQKENISMLLMPHAWPTPYKIGNGVKQEDIEFQNKELRELPIEMAKFLNCPVVFINQVGTMEKMLGLFGKLMTPDNYRLQGYSRIIESNGNVLSEMNDNEGIIYSDIDISQNKAIEYVPVPNYNGWIHEGSFIARKILAPIDIAIGQRKYKKSLSKFVKKNHLTTAST
jgi:predicted amidohydrolase